MSLTKDIDAQVSHPDRFFIGGDWVSPSSDGVIEVLDSASELPCFSVAEAREADMERAIAAARSAFDDGPWPRLTHEQRAEYLRAMGTALRSRFDVLSELWSRESGVVNSIADSEVRKVPGIFDFYADLASAYPFEERCPPEAGEGAFGLLVREPVGVVGAIVPWNAPLMLAVWKIAPALLAGCTVILKPAPEAPGSAYILAELAARVGLPPGVLNVLTADRGASETLVRDPRVDKIAFTGSTATGRRIASLCGERIARYTLELGGKSAAVILDDFDVAEAALILAMSECFLSGQVCSSLTRIVVTRARHDSLVEALVAAFSQVQVGDPFDHQTQMGPLAMARQRDRVEQLISSGVSEGAILATGGGRPRHLDRGYYIEPTVFANVDNRSTIAREEVFGPVLSVIPADDEEDAIRIANDTIYGLNASVFTGDPNRALFTARRLRSGTVGHNAMRTDFGMAFGGFKQSGVGREGGREGLLPYLETKAVILNEIPDGY